MLFFFFQAEDGIRDATVTGVQTCALPIWPTPPRFKPALEPGWGGVTPFTMRTGDQFRPTRPYALTSNAYANDFNEIKAIGAVHSSSRTTEQTTDRKSVV